MKQDQCCECGKTFELNEMIMYDQKLYCGACMEKKSGNENISSNDTARMVDPTKCAQCGFDNGETALDTSLKIPLCGKCYHFFMHRPFPRWIKLSTIVLLLIVAAGFIYNTRYLSYYLDIKHAVMLGSKGQFEYAYKKLRSIALRLPDYEDVERIADLYEGFYCLTEEDDEKALKLLKSFKNYFPDADYVNRYILQTEANVAYNDKNYTLFYKKEIEVFKSYPDDATAILGVASAAACLYVDLQKDEYREESLKYIEMAVKKITPETADSANELIDRIKYRLYSRTIIDKDDFYKRFPQGWKGEL